MIKERKKETDESEDTYVETLWIKKKKKIPKPEIVIWEGCIPTPDFGHCP